jgi:S-formylglutathione hydrolase FrmB
MKYIILFTFIFLNYYNSFSAEKIIVDIPSFCMNKNFKATVFLPNDYKTSQNYYSVIYLLHGYSGDYTTWSRIINLDQYSDKYFFIIVCPDGNFNSWYINSDIKKESNFETYIVKEVTSFIDSNYRSFKSPYGRALIGSSMGGHGALTLLAKHPDIFCGAGSISGILDITEFPYEWDMSQFLGEYSKNKEKWMQNSFYYILKKLYGLNKAIILDCGTSDFAINCNRKTHEKMLKLNIPHEYYERPGSHNPSYCQKVLEFHLLYFSRILLRPGR